MLLIQDTTGGGRSLEAIIRNRPRDAGAVVVYVLMIAFIGFIWYGSRKPPTVDEARDDTEG
jgi:hypothetical protein